jgi:ATP-dependent DNA helicase RecG
LKYDSGKHSGRLSSSTPIQYLKGVGPKLGEILIEKGIATVGDFLRILPRAYEDQRTLKKIESLVENELTVLSVELSKVHFRRLRGGRRLLDWTCVDETGTLTVMFFHITPGYHTSVKEGSRLRLVGKPTRKGKKWQMVHPQFRVLTEEDSEVREVETRIRPIYPEVQPLSQYKWHRLVEEGLARVEWETSHFREWLEEKAELPRLMEALQFLHQPPEDAPLDLLQQGRHPMFLRFVIEEFLYYELGLLLRYEHKKAVPGIPVPPSEKLYPSLCKSLPFSLTGDQEKVIAAISESMAQGQRVHALIQGDVGSGKTLVALALALQAVEAGHQVAIMAPTELLAEQHFRTFRRFVAGIASRKPIEVDLLTGSLKPVQRKIVLEHVQSGYTDILVGTHAVIQESVDMPKLALVIVDEQHRFGVQQRLKLSQKGTAPHQVHMTATPIPRTLALTLFGDMDVYPIRQKPAGRKTIRTKWVGQSRREGVYNFVHQECLKGRQGYVVLPIIEESETLDLKNATDEFDSLRGKFPDLRIELLHGRIPQQDRDSIMRRFVAGDIHILVSTTVIEVGVDVANATMMVVENAERFGLSQLHQLRGRVGRGEHESWCILISGHALSLEGEKRLSVMEECDDGFEISEKDLEIRGPGEFLGEKQSGIPSFRYANLIQHQDILMKSREWAQKILGQVSHLEREALEMHIAQYFGERLKFLEA